MKNEKITLLIVALLAFLALLASLPKIPVSIKKWGLNIDSSIGGYRLNILDKFFLDLSAPKLGLDIQGGVRVVLKAKMDKISPEERDAALKSAREVIARRVDLLGVSEPVVQTSKVGEDFRIIVELPGVSDVTEALNQIGQTAQLTFRQLKPDVKYDPSKFQEYIFDPAVWEDTGVTGGDLKGVDVVFSDETASQEPQIRLRFTNEGRNKFSGVAKKNIDKPVGLYLDNSRVPLSAPIVNPDLAAGLTNDPVISGTFTVEEANRLSISLRAGALPVPVEVIEQKNIGATLGQESVEKSLIAGAVGVAIVFAFMIVSYGWLGLYANIALLIYGLITFALFKGIPVTLTLPGIAGFILSVGMAVDANILTFERIKEELLWGRPLNLALKLGFERSWSSIRDSNFSSLITCGVLFYLGSGVVKGFALTLGIGIFVSMFTAVFVTRTLISVFYHKV